MKMHPMPVFVITPSQSVITKFSLIALTTRMTPLSRDLRMRWASSANMENIDRLEITTAAELWAWLGRHHARQDGVLLVTWKAAHRDRYVDRDSVLDALVAHGWIDGRRYTLDDDRTMQLITPRRAGKWAKSYRDRAARLESEGRMHPAGHASVAAAKAKGGWDGLPDVDAIDVPDDLADTLLAAGADGWFNQAAPSYRRNVLRWIATAKSDPTRAKRVGTVTDYASQGKKVPNY